MDSYLESTKGAEINIRFSEFEMAPMQDVLIIGKRAPIGPEAAKRVTDILSPGQYETIKIDNSIIEAIVIRKTLLNILPQDKLISLILEEGGKVANETAVIKAQVSCILQVSKLINL